VVVRTRAVVAWLALSGASGAGTSSGEEARFVPGEVIVKFRAGTPAARATSEAAAAAGGGAEAKLGPQIQGLSDAVGVPLRFRRLGSGGDLLLAVDGGRLQQKLLDALRGAAGVTQVEPISATGTGEKLSGVRIRFAPTSLEARDVARAAALPSREGPLELLEVTRRLQLRVGFPLANRLGDSGELVVEPDLAALTRDVVHRLSQRPDIQYAQLNHIVRQLRP
jgi:hypothetical protein